MYAFMEILDALPRLVFQKTFLLKKERINVMNVFKSITKIIDTTIDHIGRLLCFGALVIMVVIVIEVFSRRVFNSPTLWAYELITMVFASYVILICAYGLQHGAFVCVDVFSQKFKPLTGKIVMLVTYILFFLPFILGMLSVSWNFFWRSWVIQELSSTMWAPPAWPVKLALFVGLIMLLAQGISEMIRIIIWLVEYKKKPNLTAAEEV